MPTTFPRGARRGSDGSSSATRASAKTFLQLVQAKNREQGRSPATRTDLRFGSGPDDQIFLLNKHDGTIRLLISGD
jgi:hypothetical protein